MCSIYLSSVYSSNDILNACSPNNVFSLKNSTPNTVTPQYSLFITIIKKKKKIGVFFLKDIYGSFFRNFGVDILEFFF